MPDLNHNVADAAAQIHERADVAKVTRIAKKIAPHVAKLTIGEQVLLMERLALMIQDQANLCPLCLLRELNRQRAERQGLFHEAGHA